MGLTAVILAGGLGTRLRAVLPDVPKPMAPIRGRPFLEYLLDYWISQGIERFVLSVGYKHEMIMSYFGDYYRGVQIEYVIETKPMGTGGGLLLAAEKIESDSFFLVLNGDTYFTVDLQKLVQFAEKNDADWCFSLFLSPDVERYMGMNVSPKGKINELKSKQDQAFCHVNGGAYWVRHSTLMQMNLPQTEMISLENDIFPTALTNKQRLFGLVFDETFIDIGVPEDYCRSNLLLI